MTRQAALMKTVRQRMASGDVELPVFDGAAIELHREAHDNRMDAQVICRLLERDATLVSEVLRMSNSSFFGGLQEVRTLRDACVRLGVRQVAAIVFSISQKRLYSSSSGPFRSRFEALWQHASRVSIGARWLAERSGHRPQSDEAFIAGLLHDIGKLSSLRAIEQIVRETGRAGDPAVNEAVDDAWIDSALAQLSMEQGVRLLQHWNMPSLYIDIATRVDDEPEAGDPAVLAMVRLADRVVSMVGSGEPVSPSGWQGLPDAVSLGLDGDTVSELLLLLDGPDDSIDGARRAA